MDKDKDRLKRSLNNQIKSINSQVLNLAEMLVPNEKWSSFRSRILDITNNARRELEADIDKNYDVDYNPLTVCEDVIEVKSPMTGLSYKPKDRGRGNGNPNKKTEND